MRLLATLAALSFLLPCLHHDAHAQAEVTGWGNLQGIRVDGQLMPVRSSLCTVGANGSEVTHTAKEQQEPTYERLDDLQTVHTRLGAIEFVQQVRDLSQGTVSIDVQATASADTALAGAFVCLTLPRDEQTLLHIDDPDGATRTVRADELPTSVEAADAAATKRLQFEGAALHGSLSFEEATDLFVRRTPDDDVVQILVGLLEKDVSAGATAQTHMKLEVAGAIDHSPVTIVVDPHAPGRPFDGLGGNFRLQNPETDPPVIQYNLDHLRVAWGRVEMPWRLWHPDEDVDPVASAERGELHPRVAAAMNMARRLAQRDLPVVVSVWSGPDWAIEGAYTRGTGPDGLRGNALASAQMEDVYASIGDYLQYMKDHYGVEARMFSFNESDLGIYVRQTGEEHAAFIRGLGAHLADRGLTTGLLLGDNSDATTIDFIRPALNDPRAMRYVDAISFHSWRGWSDELLNAWGEAARAAGVPLLIGEGSTDAAAWKYPDIFDEPSFALEEITLYTRLLARAQPLSILQWQLTADYGILAGGGVFGNDEEPLRPTQRFWNLKQLASTPPGAFALPAACDHPATHCAAFGEIAKGQYAVHVVNDGAARPATLVGLPDEISELRVFTTNADLAMQEGTVVPVVDGRAEVRLAPASFTTLLGAR